MTQPTRSVQLAGYLLLVVAEFLSFDDIDTMTWEASSDNLALTLMLTGGDTIGLNTGDVSSAGLGIALQTVFEQLQQELPETARFWGQALPACQVGHSHAAGCELRDNALWLICPSEGTELRELIPLRN